MEDRINDLMIRTEIKAYNLKKSGEFKESDHPRDDDGKFGQGSGGHGGNHEESSGAETSPHQENNTQKKTIIFQGKDEPQPELPKKQSGQTLPIIVRELEHKGETWYSIEVPFHGVAETVKLTQDKTEAMDAAKKVEQSVRENGKKIREMKRQPPKVNEDLSKFFFSHEE